MFVLICIFAVLHVIQTHSIYAISQWGGPSCANISNDFVIYNSGGTFEAIGCTFTNYVSIRAPSVLHGHLSASVVVSGGNVNSGSGRGIGIVGTTITSAPSMGSLHFTVSGVTFGMDAVLNFTGQLPHNSSLVFVNNSFHLSRPSIYDVDSQLMSVGILLGSPHEPFALYGASSIIAKNNTFVAINSDIVWGILITGQPVTLSGASALVISGNTLQDSLQNLGAAAVVRWVVSAPRSSPHTFMLTDSQIFMEDNIIRNCTLARVAVVLWQIVDANSVMIISHSAISSNGNTINNSTVGEYVWVVGWWFTNCSVFAIIDSTIAFDGNSLVNATANKGALVVVWLFELGSPQVTITKSLVFMRKNYCLNVSSDAGPLYAVHWSTGTSVRLSFTISNFSTVQISNNSIFNVRKSVGASVVRWYFPGNPKGSSLAITHSTITISGNMVEDATLIDNIYSVIWQFSITVFMFNGSFVTFSNNSIRNIRVSSSSANAVCFMMNSQNLILNISRTTFAMDNNSILSTHAQDLNVVVWSTQLNAVLNIADACISMNHNRLWSSNIENEMSLVGWTILGAQHVSLIHSTFSMSYNYAIDTRCSQAGQGIVILGSITTITGSSLTLGHNWIWNSIVGGYFYLVNWDFSSFSLILNLTNASTIRMSDNTINGTDCVSNIRVVRWVFQDGHPQVTVEDFSSIYLDQNIVSYSETAASVFAVMWFFTPPGHVSLIFANNATISLSGNSIRDIAPTDRSVVVYWKLGGISSRVSFNHSTLGMNNNSFVDATSINNLQAVVWEATSNPQSILLTSSNILIDGNSIRRSIAVGDVSVAQWALQNYQLIANNSSITLSRNSIVDTRSTLSIQVAAFTCDTGNTPILVNASSSFITFNENRCVNAIAGADMWVVNLAFESPSGAYLTFTNASALQISNNSIEKANGRGEAVVARWCFSGSDASLIVKGSVISVTGNSVYNSSLTFSVYVVSLWFDISNTFTLISSSSTLISFASNSVQHLRTTNIRGDTLAIYWYFRPRNSTIILTDTTLTMRNNDIAHTVAANIHSLYISFTIQHPAFVIMDSSIFLDENYVSNVSANIIVLVFWTVRSCRSFDLIRSKVSMASNYLSDSISTLNTQVVLWRFDRNEDLQHIAMVNSSVVATRNSCRNITSTNASVIVVTWEIVVSSAVLTLLFTNATSVVIANNTLVDVKSALTIIAVLWFFDTPSALVLTFSGSVVTVNENKIDHISTSKGYAVYWYFKDSTPQIYLHQSALSFDNNRLVNIITSGSALVVAWELNKITPTILTLINSSFRMCGNHILHSQVSDRSVVVGWIFATQLTITLHSSLILLMENGLRHTITTHDEIFVVRWEFDPTGSFAMIIANDSMVTFNGNYIWHSKAVGSVALTVSWFVASPNPFIRISQSSLAFDNNSITNTTAILTACAVVWNVTSVNSSLLLLSNSHISMNGNTIANSSVDGALSTVHAIFYNCRALDISNLSSISTSNNSLTGSNCKEEGQAVLWRFSHNSPTLTITNSSVMLSRNSCRNVTVNGFLNVVYWDSKSSTQLTDSSMILVNNNSVSRCQSTSEMSVVRWYLHSSSPSLSLDRARITINDNTIRDSICFDSVRTAIWLLGNTLIGPLSLTLTNYSAISLSFNSIWNTTTTRWSTVIYWYVSGLNPTLKISQSSVMINNNSFANSALAGGNMHTALWSIAIYPQTLVIVNSNVSMDGNSFINATVRNGSLYAVQWEMYDFHLTMLHSTFTLNENTIGNSTVQNSAKVATLLWNLNNPQLTLTNSSLIVSNNSCYNVATGGDALVVHWNCRISIPFITLTNTSTVRINNNIIKRAVGSFHVHVVRWVANIGINELNVIHCSSIQLLDNTIENVTVQGDAYVVGWLIGNSPSIAFSDNSTFSVAGNINKGFSVGGHVYVVYWYFFGLSTTLLFNKSSTLVLDNNMICGVVAGKNITTINLNTTTILAIDASSCSNITMANNSVLQSAAHGGNVYAVYGAATQVALSNGSRLELVSTKVTTTEAHRTIAGVYMSTLNTLIVARNSSLNICDTLVSDVRADEVYGTLVSVANNTKVQTNSSLLIQSNRMTNISATLSVSLLNLSVGLGSINGSQFDVSDNHMDICGGTLMVGLVSLRGSSFICIDGVTLVFDRNQIALGSTNQPVGTGYFIHCALNIDLTNQSTLSITNNRAKITLSTASSSVLSFSPVVISGTGTQVSVTENNFSLSSLLVDSPPIALSFEGIAASIDSKGVFILFNRLVLRTQPSTPQSSPFPCISLGNLIGSPVVVLSDNTIEANVFVFIMSHDVRMPANGTLVFSRNVLRINGSPVTSACFFCVSGSIRFAPATQMVFEKNTVDSVNPIPSFKLLNATLIYLLPLASLRVCRNSIFGDISSSYNPHPYLHPAELLSIVRACPFTPSQFLTSSQSLTEANRSKTVSYTRSEFLEVTSTCKAIHDLLVNDTCSVLRPLPSNWPASSYEGTTATVLDASWLNASCTSISVPFSIWGGREGQTHMLGIAGIDHRVPLLNVLVSNISGTDPVVAVLSEDLRYMPITFLQGDLIDNRTASHLPGKSGVHTYTLPVGVLALRYIGKSTLSKVSYRFTCLSWVRCPVPMPLEFEVTLMASERLIPVAVTEAVDVGGSVVSVANSLTLSPTSVARMSVTRALLRMSRCEGVDLDEEGDESYSTFTGGVLNPFGIALGAGVGRRYVRGALAMSAIYLVVLSFLMLAFTVGSARLSWVVSLNRHSVKPPSFLAGHPSALVAVVAFVMDGAVSAGALLGLEGSGWGDRLVGWTAVLLCALFVASIVHATVRRFPRSLSAIPQAASEERVSKSAVWWAWFVSPTDRWQHSAKGQRADVAAQWLQRFASYIADSRLAWYCGLEQGVALFVCLLGAVSISELKFCIARGVLCSVLLGLQAAVMVVLRPPVHRWRWLLQSCVLIMQTLAAALSAANASLQEPSVELGMDSLGMVLFVLLGISTAADLLMMLLELRVSTVRILLMRKKPTQSCDPQHVGGLLTPSLLYDSPLSNSQPLLVEMLSLDEAADLSLPPAIPLPQSESAIVNHQFLPMSRTTNGSVDKEAVREILDQLRAFEERKGE